jgi:hypothetical protein
MPCSSRRITIACRDSGTRCGRFIFTERVAAGGSGDLLQSALDAWILAVGEQLAGGFAAVAIARSSAPSSPGSVIAAQWFTFGVVSAPRRTTEMSRLATAGRDRITEDHAGDRAQAAGALVRLAQFELAQGVKEFGRS